MMAKQGGQVSQEQSDMHLASNVRKEAKEGFLRTPIQET
jgi:uncharacterized protein involved in high-affinity Fe2+ transport